MSSCTNSSNIAECQRRMVERGLVNLTEWAKGSQGMPIAGDDCAAECVRQGLGVDEPGIFVSMRAAGYSYHMRFHLFIQDVV